MISWFLTLVFVHLNNQAPLPDLQVCFGRDSFSPVSSTVYSGCVWGWCPWPDGTCCFGLFGGEAMVWVLRMRIGVCLCLKTFGSNCWLEFLLRWGCRMSSAVAWILWPDLLDVQGRDVICSTICCRTGPTTFRIYSLKAWVCWIPCHEAISFPLQTSKVADCAVFKGYSTSDCWMGYTASHVLWLSSVVEQATGCTQQLAFLSQHSGGSCSNADKAFSLLS